MFLPMARGVYEHQVPQLVILVMAIPMMQLDFLFDLDHLPTARTEPVLLSQELSTKRRRRLQRQLTVAVLEVRLPGRVEGIRLALDLEIALRCDHFLYPEQVLAGGRISKPPHFTFAMGEVAVNDPPSGLVRVSALGPAIHPSPDKIVELGEGLTTEHVAMIVRPAPQNGAEGVDQLFWCGTPGLLTEGPDLVLEGLEARRARGDLEFGSLAVWALALAQGLS